MNITIRELLFEDMGRHPIVDLTFDNIGLGKQPRHYLIEELGIVVALAINEEGDILVEKAPSPETFIILCNFGDVIWFEPGSGKKDKTTFSWKRFQAGDQVLAFLGEGELLVFYADGHEFFDFVPVPDVVDISFEGEDVILHFAYQIKCSRGDAGNGFRRI